MQKFKLLYNNSVKLEELRTNKREQPYLKKLNSMKPTINNKENQKFKLEDKLSFLDKFMSQLLLKLHSSLEFVVLTNSILKLQES